MEQPMFYQGQRVVGFKVSAPGWSLNPQCPQPIDGKSYYVTNPHEETFLGLVFIRIQGFDANMWQGQFVPYDEDKAMEDEIFEALKEDLKVKNFQDN